MGSETRRVTDSDALAVSAPEAETIMLVDGEDLRRALWAAGQWLKNHAAVVNALNVFPVPDGDTGTNMSLTMTAALAEVETLADRSASAVARAVAHGSLMGARGNSGVILSQIFRGFVHSLDGRDALSAKDLGLASQEAYDTAVRGVIKPVEGTILTVMREVARATQEIVTHTDDIVTIMTHVVEVAQETNNRTPELLPVLKEAGVVDAGGQGLVYLLEGALRSLQGERVDVDVEVDVGADPRSILGAGPDGYGYDVQFLIKGESLDVDEIRQAIDAMGDSTLVVGDSRLVKVHVHVHDPGAPISYGSALAVLDDVIVENMDEQRQDFIKEAPVLRVPIEDITDIAIVCVVPGEGLTRIFESMGASAIVPGGHTMNPSTQELLAAIDRAGADKVLVLPNNGNIILAARQASEMSSKQVVVVPTKTIPEGISAMMAFNYQADLQGNAERMERNAAETQTIEITHAVRSTLFNGVQVSDGDVIGLLNDQLVADGEDDTAVSLEVLDKASAGDYEVVTVYFGQDTTQQDAAALGDEIKAIYPSLEVDVHDGGQPYYRYILSLE
ncbi:MAG: DAK2 domain-containing protein [Ardenticatenia bacterium]|nr:DAK2 domain-containing protein [Ardenticatenia bacterium]